MGFVVCADSSMDISVSKRRNCKCNYHCKQFDSGVDGVVHIVVSEMVSGKNGKRKDGPKEMILYGKKYRYPKH